MHDCWPGPIRSHKQGLENHNWHYEALMLDIRAKNSFFRPGPALPADAGG